MLCQCSRCTRSSEGAQPGQLTRLTKGIFCIIEHPTQSVNWRELAGSHGSLLRVRLGIGPRPVSSCVVHHSCVSLGCYSPLLRCHYQYYSYNLFLCQLLNCSYLHPRGLPVLSNSFCWEEVGSEQTAVWYIVPSWVSAMPVVSLFDVCMGSAVYVFRLGICSAVLLVV